MKNLYSWNETASGLARQVRQNYSQIERGVVPLRFIDDSAGLPHFVEDGPLVVGVFGNDNYLSSDKARREIALVRERLKEIEADEMGFGISDDGESWAMLVGVDRDRYQTKAGQIMQKELLKAFLERAITDAWRHVCGLPAEPLGTVGSEPGGQSWILIA